MFSSLFYLVIYRYFFIIHGFYLIGKKNFLRLPEVSILSINYNCHKFCNLLCSVCCAQNGKRTYKRWPLRLNIYIHMKKKDYLLIRAGIENHESLNNPEDTQYYSIVVNILILMIQNFPRHLFMLQK